MPEIFSNTTLTVNQLIEKIDTGELGLPELQRPFIWKDSKVRDLFDSMMRGYPIGYLMLWECPSLDKKKSIGVDAHSYDSPKEVIIDGQQRLTSLYAVMKGKKVINSKFDEKSIVISYCPLQNKFEVGYKPRRTTQNGFIILVTCSLPRTPLSSSVISSRNWVTIDPPKGPSLQMKNRA